MTVPHVHSSLGREELQTQQNPGRKRCQAQREGAKWMSMVLLLLISLSVGMAWQAELGDRTADQEGQTKKGAREWTAVGIIQCLPTEREQSKSALCRHGGTCLYSQYSSTCLYSRRCDRSWWPDWSIQKDLAIHIYEYSYTWVTYVCEIYINYISTTSLQHGFDNWTQPKKVTTALYFYTCDFLQVFSHPNRFGILSLSYHILTHAVWAHPLQRATLAMGIQVRLAEVSYHLPSPYYLYTEQLLHRTTVEKDILKMSTQKG